jgi:hypothetical protein
VLLRASPGRDNTSGGTATGSQAMSDPACHPPETLVLYHHLDGHLGRHRRPERRVGVRSSPGAPVTRRYAAGPVSTEAAAIDPVPAGQPWGARRRLARVPMPGTVGGGLIMRRNPCSSHGHPPSGLPGTEGTVLICPWCDWPHGLPDGGFNSVLWGFNSVARVTGAGLRVRGGSCWQQRRLSPRCPEEGASLCGCRSLPLARAPGPPSSSFPQVTGSACAAGWHCRLPWAARCRPGRPVVVSAWSGDRSPVWGCTTTGGDQVPPRTHGG